MGLLIKNEPDYIDSLGQSHVCGGVSGGYPDGKGGFECRPSYGYFDVIQYWLTPEEIEERIAKKQAEQQVADVQSNKAWADKYGNLQYHKVGDKVTAMLPPEVQPWTDFICDTCGDTGELEDYKGLHYPCSCEKGTARAKNTGYMGPVTVINKKKLPLYVDYNKKFVDKLKENTGKVISIFSGSKNGITDLLKADAEKSEQLKQIDVEIGQYTKYENMTDSVTEIVAGSDITSPPKPVTYTPPEVPEGRKFRKARKD